MTLEISISPEVRAAAPRLKVAVVEARVVNPPTDDALWTMIGEAAESLRATMPMDQINKREAIAATRAAYKALGKEPNRYRPSAEALCRRCVKGMELYRTLAIIDLINYMSIVTGHSIGGFDLDYIQGGKLELGVGAAGEPYEAIGRGQLNIAGLPVFRDSVGGVGTPTSDNERTKLSASTTRLLMTINLYDGCDAEPVVGLARALLERFASATEIEYTII